MNAYRRLEEFISKLSTRQNEAGQFDKLNIVKANSDSKNIQMSKGKSDSKNINK